MYLADARQGAWMGEEGSGRVRKDYDQGGRV